MTLPGSPHIAYRDKDLFIEDRKVADLAREFGTPLYAYSRASLLGALAAYQRALEGRDHLICYAMKANSNRAVVQTFARAGCGFDIVSGGELERVLAAGIEASRVVEQEINRMMQLGFFNEQTRLEKLTKLGDSLKKLNIIDWEIFRDT